MRLLLTGANGQLGWELRRSLATLGEVVALCREDCNLAEPKHLPDVIGKVKPDVIVNAAAYTAVDKAEQETELAYTINSKSVGVLAEAARKAQALFIHYSTDYVFDGQKNAPYTEDDLPNPLNVYGHSKLAGDTAIQQAADNYIILRTSWIYAARGHNFVRTLIRLAQERQELEIVADQIGAPTWAHDVADVTSLIILTAVGWQAVGRFQSGLFNVTAAGAVSWYEFAKAILLESAKHGGLLNGRTLPHLHAIPSASYSSPAVRPKNSQLSCDRARRLFAISLPNWKISLARCLAELQPNQEKN